MSKPKVLILRTAGTNCDKETAFAFELAGAKSEVHHVNRLVDKEIKLSDYQCLTIPGGFSYGDDIAAGKILAVELVQMLGEQLVDFVSKGNPVLGICNGFQVLVKTGFLPDTEEKHEQTVTLTANDSNRYEDRWVYLKCPTKRCIFTDEGQTIFLPVAHGEGKLVTKNEEQLTQLFENGQVVFQYVDKNGAETGYPGNPNGSPRGVAALCNPGGNVMGLMPHPERHLLGIHNPLWTRIGLKEKGDGFRIFENAVKYMKKS